MSTNQIIDWEKYLKNADVIYMDAEDVQPTENNPRFIKDASFRDLMRDIVKDPEFLRQRPILINKTDAGNFIYAGHQRWRACLEMGIKVPVSIDENLSKEVMERRMVLDNVHFGVFDSTKFSDFEESMLEDLGLSEMDGRLKFDIRGYRGDNEDLKDEALDRLKKDPKDKTSAEDTITHGAHEVTIIFSTEDEQLEFFALSKNFTLQDERLEDAFIRKIKE